jgi:photosystem II stability/assembly factor-like uncharacterized protein
MKNRLLFPVIFAFIFSSCSDFSGNEDAVEASLKPAPVTTTTTTTTTTREYYHLNGITFGNNTFVAVGKNGTVRTSSDNGTSWDNGTRGTTSELNKIAYGNSTFVAVGKSGTHLYSRDDGATWDNGTWSPTANITGVAFGKNTFIGVSSTYLTKSTDNGSNWGSVCSGMKVYDVAFGNSKFVGSGLAGAIGIYDNDSVPVCSLGDSGTLTHTLYGITFGNNQFFSVGSSGKLIMSGDNGSTFSNKTSPTTITLKSTVFGNNTFVAVGPQAVVVSNNVGGSALKMADEYTFNDITFGNGVFVAVGNDEIIYTSTDGDDWTQVHGF